MKREAESRKAGQVSATPEIIFSSTGEIAAAIRTGEVSALEVLEAHLKQIDAHNGALNAVVIIDADAARKRARQADAAIARGEIWGPLHGVPHTLKDCHGTAGMRSTAGFPPFAGHVASEDSAVAARLKAAGAVLVGKTNVAMMLADYQSSNPIFGRTCNPWNIERTAGGSSGGAAAALAAGMTPFEIGTDLSASIRIPAHFCGVYGLKPTENRVSLVGVFPDPRHMPRSIRMMLSIGPMARTPDDLALLYRLIAGPDGRDTDVNPVPVENVPELALKGLRIAFAATFADFPVAADIRETAQDVAMRLDQSGALVEEAALPELEFSADLSSGGELTGMMIGALEDEAPPVNLKQYFAALARRDRSIVAWEKFFETCDVLLCPASMDTAFPHCEPGTSLKVDGKDANYWMVSAHGALFNYSGNPAIVIPCGFDRDGLPIGLQLVGKRWDESRLLAIAKAVSQVTCGFRRPAGY
jgi:amidase